MHCIHKIFDFHEIWEPKGRFFETKFGRPPNDEILAARANRKGYSHQATHTSQTTSRTLTKHTPYTHTGTHSPKPRACNTR